MKHNYNPYNLFSNFVLRTPLLDFDFFLKLTEKEFISNDTLKKAYNDPLVKESCYLASPTLYHELEKWTKGKLDKKKENRVRLSLLKYLTRMSTRCTPFGLFAGCCLGDFDNFTSIKNSNPRLNKRHTRLDMNYLVALSQELSKKKEIRDELLFFPNSSIYLTGNQLRYVEYYYVNSIRHHQVIEVDNSEYLQKILERATNGAHIENLINLLVEDNIAQTDAKNFINELLESQLLVSELEPSVCGPEFMFQILKILKKVTNAKEEIQFLSNVQKQLDGLDQHLGNTPKTYISLSDKIKKHSTSFDLKFLFQTDLELKPQENKLSVDIMTSIKKGMELMNKLTLPKTENNLSKFKDTFFERYEEREMQLSKVLDVETGIGYIQNGSTGDFNPLIDDIHLPVQDDPYEKTTISQNSINRILEEKLISCDKNGSQRIKLTEKDFEGFPSNWEDLPDTLSGMIKIITEDGQKKILFPGISGSSAANLIGRFCHADKKLSKFTQKITDLESKMNPNKILAEIVHLPEARVGNILMRPSFRQYEIPYLAKSNSITKHQISLEDLFISIKNNRIYLRSKKLDKEVIPRLTNAHNYYRSTLPIYQFLCDMQTQNQRTGIYFDFDYLGNNRSFIPRVEFENLILHRAKWKLKKEDINNLLQKKEDSNLKKEVDQLRKKFNIPQFVLSIEDDKELLINFSNMTSVQILLDEVKNKTQFILSEFLFSDDGIVKSETGYYTHQIIVSAYNDKKMNSIKEKSND